MPFESPSRVTAVLGPTNTGKTHYAIERMLAHRTGVIGLPLRLLAREVYDRIVAPARPVGRGAGHRRGADRPGARRLLGLHRRGDAARHAAPTSSRWTRSSSAPIPSGATSSPTGCSTRAACTRRCSSAPRRCAAPSRPRAGRRSSCSASGSRRSPTPGRRRSAGCRRAAPSSASRSRTSTPSPS